MAKWPPTRVSKGQLWITWFESPGAVFPRCFQSSVHLSADLVLHHCHLRKDCFPRWPPLHSKGPQQKQNWCNKAWGCGVFPNIPPCPTDFSTLETLSNGQRWSKTWFQKPIITWISHPILIQKVAPKKSPWENFGVLQTRQDLPKKRFDLLQLILHSTVVATIMVAAPSGHCALTGGGSSPAREGMNPPIFSSHGVGVHPTDPLKGSLFFTTRIQWKVRGFFCSSYKWLFPKIVGFPLKSSIKK